jgi:hypothetical protein
MTTSFESEKNKKALLYTFLVCGLLLLMFVLISWKDVPPAPPQVMEEIEINLGNNDEGFGEEQPLIKGEMAPSQEAVVIPQQRSAATEQNDEAVNPDDNAEADAAPVNKPIKATPKVVKPNTTVPAPTAAPKPQKPKLTYNGPGTGGGNNATEDNGYRYQGNKPGGTGDAGDPTGDKDSYGNTPGGKIGGPRVIRGNRKIIRYYSFTSELPKATIYADIKVSPSGVGTFSRIVKPSTSFEQRYATAISGYLRNMQFDKGDDEGTVTVQFNFTVN